MKRDFFEDDLPDYSEELWNDLPTEGRRSIPRRARKKKQGKNKDLFQVLLGSVAGVLLGLSIGILGPYLLFTRGGVLLPGLFGQGDSSYSSDDEFGFDHDGDVETNQEASQEYSLPLYQGDSSGLTISLQPGVSGEVLSEADLYEKDLPSTVSITVYAGNSAAYGSGMILTSDGYILTCAHVIENTESAVITTSEGEEYEAALVGSDIQTDLAVLKIDASGLTPVTFANSDDLVIGEEVCAIGDPLGPQFRGSLTNGIISGLNRQISSNGYAMTLIQTTAPVNSGNSGGPLFNSRGQVVGVVNMKMSGTGSSASIDNMGLAVPSVTVKEIVETLATEGRISRAVLGISCYSINKTTARVYDLPQGLCVTTIDPNSDCAKQGVLQEDIITQVDGVDVSSVSDFKTLTSGFKVGDTVTLTIWREPETDSADGSASTSVPEGYYYEYYGEITVALMDSNDLTQ